MDAQGVDIPLDEVGEPLYLLMPLQDISLPSLEHFEVRTPWTLAYHHAFQGDLFSAPQAAPKLSFVGMDIYSFSHFIPPRSITTLDLHWSHKYGEDVLDGPLDSLLLLWEFMSLCPTLTTLSIIGNMFGPRIVQEFQQNGIYLTSNLQHFRCSDSRIVQVMWRYIRLPRLELLVLEGLIIDEEWDLSIGFSANDILPALRTLVFVDCQTPSLYDFFLFAGLTNNTAHLYILQNTQCVDGNSPIYNDHTVLTSLAISCQESSLNTLWPNIVSLTFTRPQGYQPSHAEVLRYSELVLARPTQCTLRLTEDIAEYWKSKHSALWLDLQEMGLVEIISTDSGRSAVDLVPWPSREPGRPMHIFGDPFLDS